MVCFNPATGLMLIPAGRFGGCMGGRGRFNPATGLMLIPADLADDGTRTATSFNPATGLMLIPANRLHVDIFRRIVLIPRLG